MDLPMNTPISKKSDLLGQLKIDRETQTATSSMSLLGGVIIAFISALCGAIFSYYFISPSAGLSPEQQQKSQSITHNSRLPTTDTPASAVNNKPPPLPIPEAILNASGYITARRMATVSAEIMGLIKEVAVEEGMQVSEGQVLARLDDTLAKVNLDLAKAQLESHNARRKSARASLAEAQRQYQRVTVNQFSSEAERTKAQTELETFTANLASIVADIKVAKFEIRRQEERLADHIIRAPFSGVVTVKNAQPGEIVAPASAGGGFTRTGICTIVDMHSLEIEVDVNEFFIGRVYPQQKVEAHLDAYPDWSIPAAVIAIIPTADRAKATVRVRISIDNNDPKILPDMGVKVAFLKSEE